MGIEFERGIMAYDLRLPGNGPWRITAVETVEYHRAPDPGPARGGPPGERGGGLSGLSLTYHDLMKPEWRTMTFPTEDDLIAFLGRELGVRTLSRHGVACA
jgi:hypothetical protein